ncbi:MAG: LysM peptidoglycan-binding domain-containing protein [Chloroflexi bacterium]|nr:LysM peptidoglycan-binding domain-containing protein [Chloroflexota bacterium]
MKINTQLKVGRWYTVQKGDTLSKIAYTEYKNAYKWPEIYATNKKIIGNDPDFLKEGIIIKI